MTVEQRLDLTCHPSTHSTAVSAIAVNLRRTVSTGLKLTFRVDGDIPRILLPSPRAPRFTTQLWQHTCFEAFVAVEGQSAYHEFNFAPSGEWTVYSFRGYRDGSPIADEAMNPLVAMRSAEGRLELDATIRLDALSALHPTATLRIGLAAVVEASDGFSYWALRHAADKPDFHDAEGFALRLEPAGG